MLSAGFCLSVLVETIWLRSRLSLASCRCITLRTFTITSKRRTTTITTFEGGLVITVTEGRTCRSITKRTSLITVAE